MWDGQKFGNVWSMLRESANRAIMWIWQGLKTGCRILGRLERIQWAFLGIAIVAAMFGYHLQEKAFPLSAPSPFAQVSATVYTRSNPSRVLLKAWIAPNASQKDLLDITVKGPHGKRDPWLLVVTCPHHVAGRVKMQLVGAGVAPAQSPYVLASVHDRSHELVPLGCVGGPGQHGAAQPVVATGQDINLSLPVLEQIPLGQSSVASTPLYVMRGSPPDQLSRPNLMIKPNLPIKKLIEVFQAPGSVCPGPGASATPSPYPSATAPSMPGNTNGEGSSPASPSPGASTGKLGNSCFPPLPTDVILTKYSIPASVATSETLENVSLSGDRIDSMFPPGQITSSNQIIWQGVFGLSPDLSATSLTNDENASRDGFFAGLCYGLAAGLLVPFLQGLSDAHEQIQEEDEDSAQSRAAGHTPDSQADTPVGG